MQAYSDPKRESDPHALPDLEVFEARVLECSECGGRWPEGEDTPGLCPIKSCLGTLTLSRRKAWWWWSCSPGCLPDGDVNGPFESQEKALEDARDGLSDDYENENVGAPAGAEPGKGFDSPRLHQKCSKDGCDLLAINDSGLCILHIETREIVASVQASQPTLTERIVTPEPKSWKVEVIADSSGKWCSNSLRFKNEKEAKNYGEDLASRWISVTEWRAAPDYEQEPNR